jgi:hypothetical protein
MSYQGFSLDFFRPTPSAIPINENEVKINIFKK